MIALIYSDYCCSRYFQKKEYQIGFFFVSQVVGHTLLCLLEDDIDDVNNLVALTSISSRS